MKLSTYLTTRNITSLEFSKMVGCSYQAVCKWRQRDRIPRPKMMKKITKKTKNKVKVQDFYT